MRVSSVTTAPLFPDDGPLSRRLLRRALGIGLELILFVVVTVLFPVLAVVAAIVDLSLWLARRKPWVALRMLAMLWWFLFGEFRALVGLIFIWVFTGGPFGRGSLRRRRWLYNLRVHWIRSHLAGVSALFNLRWEVEGIEAAGPGPVIVMMRHASIVDNALPDALVSHAHGIGLRYVIKRELEVLPTIDIGARWVPTIFVRRASADAAGEVAALRRLAHELEAGEGILIYPEGTRFTERKLARAKEVIAERQPELSPLAERLEHLLPPRLGGPLALLGEAAGVDVVFCAHVGFDGFQHLRHIWSGRLVGQTIRVAFWRRAAAEVPAGDAERAQWLYERWLELDRWVADQHAAAGT